MEDIEGILQLERAILDPVLGSTFDSSCLPNEIKELAVLLLPGRYGSVLKISQSILDFSNLEILKQSICNFLSENNNNLQSQFQVFSLGVSCLQSFVESNWLGIRSKSNWDIENHKDLQEEARTILVCDGESLLPKLKNILYLLVAKLILQDLIDNFSCLKLAKWWLLRCLVVHQRVLEESSPTLYSVFQNKVNLEELQEVLQSEWVLKTFLEMEVAYFYLLYGEVQNAKDHFHKAEQSAGFHVEWIGALGKRTRFQQEPIAQLTVRVHSLKIADVSASTYTVNYFPKDVKLEDENRLNKIVFVNEDDNVLPDLHPLYQALLLSLITQIERTRPKDELRDEELFPLLNCILGFPKVWSLHISSLLIRSKLESDHRRTLERSMMQLQELVDSLSKSVPSSEVRMEFFYVSRLPLEWELQGNLADLFLSLGAVNSALDIFLNMEMWEKVITCYQLLEMKHKAEEIVRQELNKNETPKLWCLLGDCTDDIKCYERAWDLSNHSSARAQRDWAYFYYKKKQYKESIPHFQKSLQINGLQEGVLLRLGFAALEIEDWDTAATAYRRYCALNSESFEAWNNIAKCYVKLGQKARAWKALQEAVKCNYENWKVWDNLMAVSTDCGEFEEMIRSYHRILDLKEKHVDNQVLRILVQAIAEGKEDNYGNPVSRLGPAAQKLLGRLTSQVSNNAQLWEIYADLVAAVDQEGKPETLFRVAQALQKSYRSAVQEVGWEKDVGSCVNALNVCHKFLDSCLAMLAKDGSKESVQLASSAKLGLRSVTSQVTKYYQTDIPANIDDLVQNLGIKLNSLVETFTKFSQ